MQSKEKSLIECKQGIFSKIKMFFRKIFFRKEKLQQIDFEKNEETRTRGEFRQTVIVQEDLEKQRILGLKKKLDNNQILEEDIEWEDMDALINLYNEETNKLNQDTEVRKKHIQKMLQELRMAN